MRISSLKLFVPALTLEMFQPRGEEGEEKEVTAWRLKKYLRMQDNRLRPEFRKPADMPMSGPSMTSSFIIFIKNIAYVVRLFISYLVKLDLDILIIF